MQRYLSVPSEAAAVTALWWNALGIGFLALLCGYAGMVVFAFYHACDPVKAGQVEKKDQLFPLFVMQIMADYPGVPGLFVTGVFSGALSTVSSGLNSLAAVCLTDFLQLGCSLNITEKKKTLITQLLALFIGLCSFTIIFLVGSFPLVTQATISVFGAIGGPILGVFTLGMLVPFASSIGALAGTLVSLLFVLWLNFGQLLSKRSQAYEEGRWGPPQGTSTAGCPDSWTSNTTAPQAPSLPSTFLHLGIYDVSYMWYGPFSFITCMLVGVLVSLVFKQVKSSPPRPAHHPQICHLLAGPSTPGSTIDLSWLTKASQLPT